jgi:hypothetical protein
VPAAKALSAPKAATAETRLLPNPFFALTQHKRCVRQTSVIPDFRDDGLLPAGVHWSDWAGIATRFGINVHRTRLLEGLRRGVKSLGIAGCKRLFIDGSFVTRKEYPADFDACWDIEGVDLRALRAQDPALLSFANSRVLMKAKFFGEFFPAAVAAESAYPFRTFFEFFQQDKATGLTKGIVGHEVEIMK